MTFDKERGRKTVKPPARPRKPRLGPPRRESAFEGDRVAKVMARVGVCSRRDAEAWIRAGRVTVNGLIITDPAKNITHEDQVTVDGRQLAEPEKTRLFLFNKPRGLVTTDHDPEGRPTVFAWLEHHHPDLPRVVSIGRLDINTEGLLLLTNDGGLARVLELPATGWLRRYRVRAHGTTTPDAVAALKDGVTIDGVDYQPVEATLDRVQGANTWLTVALREGKNREVRRVLEHLGLEVNRLIRLSYGPFQLGEAPDGAVEEVRTRVLMDQLGPGLIVASGADFSSLRREEESAYMAERDAAAAPPPKRDKPEAGKRKHVSALRAERPSRDAGERVRTERGATTDRRGRTVKVERVAAAVATREAPDTRNGRRFQAERTTGPETGKRGRPDGARSSRDDRAKPRSDDRAKPRSDDRAKSRSDDRAKSPRRDDRPPARFGRDERPARSGPRETVRPDPDLAKNARRFVAFGKTVQVAAPNRGMRVRHVSMLDAQLQGPPAQADAPTPESPEVASAVVNLAGVLTLANRAAVRAAANPASGLAAAVAEDRVGADRVEADRADMRHFS